MTRFVVTRGVRLLTRLIPLLLLITGTTGLVYEVVLARFLSLHLGSSGASQAITLAAFLGGLSTGALLVGRYSDRWLSRLPRPIYAWAALEAAIGVWALLLPTAADAVFGTYDGLIVGLDPTSPAMVALKLACAGLLMLPLSVPMGATLPVLAACIERHDRSIGVRVVSRFYYINAAGGALGALLAGFVLIERLGLELPLTLAAMLNIVVAAVVVQVFRRLDASPPPVAEETVAPQGAGSGGMGGARVYVLAAGLTGFVTLSYEVVWTRLAGLLMGASVYAFATMLFVVIAGIASGSALATWVIGRGVDGRRVFWWSQVLAALAALGLVLRLAELPVDLLMLRIGFEPVAANYVAWLWVGGGMVAAHLMPGAIALGAAFPALLACASSAGARTDRATAWLLGVNTIGNLLGALLASFYAMPALGVEGLLIVGALISLATATLCAGGLPRLPALVTPALVGALAITLLVAPPDISLLYRGLFRARARTPAAALHEVSRARRVELAYRHDGKDTSVSLDRLPDGNLLFRIGGKVDGGTNDAPSQSILGHLGFLFRPAARDVMVIGLGTGQTAAAVAAHSATRVLVSEISPGMVGVTRRFAAHNQNVLDNPRVEVVYTDGRELMQAQPPNSFDMVVSEPSNPWVVGVADLYTVEHFERLRQRMRPGAVLLQWLQAYETDDDLLVDVVCTVHGAFEHMAVFRMAPNDLALAASDAPLAVDMAAAASMLRDPAVQSELAGHADKRLPRTLDEFLLLQLSGRQTIARMCQGWRGGLSERFPMLEYRAPAAFFVGATARRARGALDARLRPDADTELARALRLAPPSERRKDALHRYLVRANYRDELPLRLATAAAFDQLPKGLQQVATHLPEPVSVTTAARSQACELLRRRGAVGRAKTVYGPLPLGPLMARWERACAGPTQPPPTR